MKDEMRSRHAEVSDETGAVWGSRHAGVSGWWAETEKTEETEARAENTNGRWREKSVCKRRLVVTLKRSLNGVCPHTLMASGSPASAQPAWERLRAASRR